MEVNLFIFSFDDMKRFLHYFSITILCVLLIDGLGRLGLNLILNNIPDNTSHLSKVYKSLSVKDVDFIVVGMSTAEHNYNIAILEDSLQMKGYNCGSDGRNLYYDYMVVKNAINNNSLRMVFVDVSYYSLTNVTKDRINIAYPFYWKNSVVRDVVKDLNGEKMDFFMLSSMYQLNSGIHNIWRLYHPLFSEQYKGFTPYPYTNKVLDEKTSITPSRKLSVDESAIVYLDRIINECKNSKVSVVLVTSPLLGNDDETIKYLTSYANKRQIAYLDFSQNAEIINDSRLFKDNNHLNKKGADVFSTLLANHLKINNY